MARDRFYRGAGGGHRGDLSYLVQGRVHPLLLGLTMPKAPCAVLGTQISRKVKSFLCRLLDKLAGHFLEPKSWERPLAIMHHPRILSPLAKPLEGRPHLTARFELFIRGWEVVNAYT